MKPGKKIAARMKIRLERWENGKATGGDSNNKILNGTFFRRPGSQQLRHIR
jgi:hypothetical protein